MNAPTLRLILGDQLNPLHSWFAAPSDDVIHVLIEMRQETDYVLHHAQKILAIFAAMRAFGEHYRAVLANPSGNDHANIRALQDTGLGGVQFAQQPLKRKV